VDVGEHCMLQITAKLLQLSTPLLLTTYRNLPQLYQTALSLNPL